MYMYMYMYMYSLSLPSPLSLFLTGLPFPSQFIVHQIYPILMVKLL
jgi:hypothetical protein